MEKIWIGIICVIAAVCAGCVEPVAPIDYEHLCDREKRAVWAATSGVLGTPEPSADLMSASEWPHLQGALYFLPLREGCQVMRV